MHFEEAQHRFMEVLTSVLEKESLCEQDEFFDTSQGLSTSDAVFCAEDFVRNRKFFEAISESLNSFHKTLSTSPLCPNGTGRRCLSGRESVVDAGSGTGILGIFALFLGAEKCYFIDKNPFSLELNKKIVQELGFLEKSEFILGDANEISLPEKYDLLISETISSGFVAEDFPKIIDHLRTFGKEESVIIAEKFEVIVQEESGDGKICGEHFFSFLSKEGIGKKEISLNSSLTQNLRWKTKAYLYEDITLESGESMSFLNERVTKVTDRHSVFDYLS